jgi:hypothetical protein
LTIKKTKHFLQPYLVSQARAVLETVAYSDIFDYPLRLDELRRYLPFSPGRSELFEILEYLKVFIELEDGYYILSGRKQLILLRHKREAASQRLLKRAVFYGRILGSLPFIRFVGLTGSLAMRNCDDGADIDFMLVAIHGRVWLARAFVLIFGRLTALLGNTICPNLIISDQILEWRKRDLYTARELCQMIPISGLDVYTRLRRINSWTNSFLPNASYTPDIHLKKFSDAKVLRFLYEWPLQGIIGDRIESWEMNRKIKRFIQQAGYGPETQFNRDICQGNFNQHGRQTKAAFQQRLNNLGLELKDY